MSSISLLYVSDPLCGWCYGMIPALRHLSNVAPDIPLEVMPGGMWVGSPSRPYADFAAMIKGAEGRLQEVTGRKPSAAFHALISGPGQLDAASERPCLAILLMKETSPHHAVEFAHALQEAHFGAGADLNLAATYDAACDQIGAPRLDTDQIIAASLDHPKLQQAFHSAAALGPRGFPTIFVQNRNGQVIGAIPSTYDPDRFAAQVQAFK